MNFEVIENHDIKGKWHVEAFDDEGACLSAIFTGRYAEQRARHYADGMNQLLADDHSFLNRHATSK